MTCASLALADAGVEMYDLVIGCAAVSNPTRLLLLANTLALPKATQCQRAEPITNLDISGHTVSEDMSYSVVSVSLCCHPLVTNVSFLNLTAAAERKGAGLGSEQLRGILSPGSLSFSFAF